MPVYPIRGRGARVGTSWVRGSRNSATPSNKWQRPRENHPNPEMGEGSSNVMNSIGTSSQQVDSPDSTTSMVKRGSYQLVSKTKMDHPTPTTPTSMGLHSIGSPNRGRKRKLGGQPSPHHSLKLVGHKTWKASTAMVNHENVTDDGKPSAAMVRRGTHQLVLKNKSKTNTGESRFSEEGESAYIPSMVHPQHQENDKTKEGEQQEQVDESIRRAPSLKKIGSHKMVLDNRTDHNQGTSRQTIPQQHNVDIGNQTNGQNQSGPPRTSNSREAHGRTTTSAKPVGPRRGQTSSFASYNNRMMPKRIRLTTTDATVQEVLDSDEQDNDKPKAAETNDAQERLSKFAYCEIGRKGPQRRNMNRTLKIGGSQVGQGAIEQPRKMGLIRANRTNIPVCPFYAKGMECTDQFCQKRHDVPIESAVPVCSFFQRSGQCLKENCRFRHIKVNAQAAICSSFALLGYCENADCTMKHVVGASQQIHSSKTIKRRNIQDDCTREP